MPADGSQDRTRRADSIVFEKSIPPDYRWVRRVIHEAEEAFSKSGIPACDIGSVTIVLAEILNNVVEHAVFSPKDQHITLIIRHRSKSLMVEIRDNGRPMPQGRVPVGHHPMRDKEQFEALPEGGYGWFMIREIVQDLIYDRRDDENILFFRYPLSG